MQLLAAFHYQIEFLTCCSTCLPRDLPVFNNATTAIACPLLCHVLQETSNRANTLEELRQGIFLVGGMQVVIR